MNYRQQSFLELVNYSKYGNQEYDNDNDFDYDIDSNNANHDNQENKNRANVEWFSYKCIKCKKEFEGAYNLNSCYICNNVYCIDCNNKLFQLCCKKEMNNKIKIY